MILIFIKKWNKNRLKPFFPPHLTKIFIKKSLQYFVDILNSSLMVFIVRFTQKQNAFIFHYNKHAEKKKVSHLQCNFRTSCSSKISFNGFVWFSGWAFLNLKALFRAWETVSPTHSASSACQSKLNIQLRISAHQKQHTWKTNHEYIMYNTYRYNELVIFMDHFFLFLFIVWIARLIGKS